MRTRTLLLALVIVAALAVLGALAGALVVYSGIVNVAATVQHTAPVFRLLDLAMKRSVSRHASGVVVPPLADPALSERGRVLHARHCVQCHGAPGIAPDPWSLGLRPLPGNLVHTSRDAKPAELYWIVKYGIKMAGMPAWEFRLEEDELWAVVAFLQQLPWLTPERYRELSGVTAPRAAPPMDAVKSGKRAAMPATPPPAEAARPGAGAAIPVAPPPLDPFAPRARRHGPSAAPAGDPKRGAYTIQQYGCTTCHLIPGIVGPDNPVGPPLSGMRRRGFIAGVLPNTPENLVRWLLDPPAIDPRTAMPNLGLAERDAIDIAAFLYSGTR